MKQSPGSQRPCRRRANAKGFTLAETLAATMALAIVVPMAMEALSLAHRAGVVADRQRIAVRLADNLLTEIVETDQWRDLDSNGDFGAEYPGYRWECEKGDWETDTMRQVTVSVFYVVQGREYSVRLSTLALAEEQAE